jgi:hypothetical protein
MALSGLTLPTHDRLLHPHGHPPHFVVLQNDAAATNYHETDNDDSAEILHNSRRVWNYKTLYGCCGRTVEGEWDTGSQDEWCYEGRHMVSISTKSFYVKPFYPFYSILLVSFRIDRHERIPVPYRLDTGRRETHLVRSSAGFQPRKEHITDGSRIGRPGRDRG